MRRFVCHEGSNTVMSENVHRQFLSLLGWEGEELEAFLPQWKRAAKFLCLSDKDVAYAVNEYLPTYWSLSLKGIRMMAAACIKEIVELSKTAQYIGAGDSVMYINIPSVPVCIYANKLAGKGRLHVSYPGYMMVMIRGAFFNKGAGCYGNAVNGHCAHCKMNSIRANAIADGKLPPPTITWNWGIKCGEAPKTDELIACLGGTRWKNTFITLPHDAPLGDVEADDRKRIDFLAEKLRMAQRDVSDATGIEVTEEHLQKALEEYMHYMDLVEQLSDLVMNADPQPVTVNEMTLFGTCVDMCFDIGYSYLNHVLEIFLDEVRERVAQGIGALPKNAPKMFCQFNSLYAPWIDKAFRENGVCLTQGRMFPFAHIFREYLNEKDVYTTVARMSLATPSSMNMMDEARIYADLLNRYHADGALYGFYAFDKWVGAVQKTMVCLIEAKTGVPHFYLEGDLWDSDKKSEGDRMTIIRSICNCLKISKI